MSSGTTSRSLLLTITSSFRASGGRRTPTCDRRPCANTADCYRGGIAERERLIERYYVSRSGGPCRAVLPLWMPSRSPIADRNRQLETAPRILIRQSRRADRTADPPVYTPTPGAAECRGVRDVALRCHDRLQRHLAS